MTNNESKWNKAFPTGIVTFKKIKTRKSWNPLFDKLTNDSRFKEKIEKTLTEELKDNPNVIMHPPPNLVFNTFNLTSFKKLKVVVLGQDPYFKYERKHGECISQAMGLSFSVPKGLDVPSSLKNIYSNLLKYNHIKKIPSTGDLTSWAEQGVLMLNTSLTVKQGAVKDDEFKNCHQNVWKWFTDDIIKYISENKSHVVFVLWGAPALTKKDLIDETKHKVIVSSHPSGLSCNKPLRHYSPFASQDHFGEINETLKKWKKDGIDWTIE